MKKLILMSLITTILSFVIATNVNAQVLGTVDGQGVPTLTFSAETLLEDWNDFLEENQIPGTLTSVTIEAYDSKYYLVATGTASGEPFKSAALLSLDEQDELTFFTVGGTKTVCTTTSCANCCGCQPTIDGYCSYCSVSLLDCTRNTTQSLYLF